MKSGSRTNSSCRLRRKTSPHCSRNTDSRSHSADLENISLTFCKNDTYDYIGKDASLENLDMMSAISDMQKDKVLEQYQYFVKPKDVLLSDVDGTVIQK